jgi:hypothetical protein
LYLLENLAAWFLLDNHILTMDVDAHTEWEFMDEVGGEGDAVYVICFFWSENDKILIHSIAWSIRRR